jgi:hypothetical protein
MINLHWEKKELYEKKSFLRFHLLTEVRTQQLDVIRIKKRPFIPMV